MLAAALNSVNAAASSATTTAGYKMSAAAVAEYDHIVALLEEGWRPPHPDAPPPVLAEGSGRRRREETRRGGGHPCNTAWKITIRSFVAVATLIGEAFVLTLTPSCDMSWSNEWLPFLASLVMLAMSGAFVWALTLDYFWDPDYHRKKKKRKSEQGGEVITCSGYDELVHSYVS